MLASTSMTQSMNFMRSFSSHRRRSRHGAAVGSLIRKKGKIDSIQRIFARLIQYKAAAIHMISIAEIMS